MKLATGTANEAALKPATLAEPLETLKPATFADPLETLKPATLAEPLKTLKPAANAEPLKSLKLTAAKNKNSRINFKTKRYLGNRTDGLARFRRNER